MIYTNINKDSYCCLCNKEIPLGDKYWKKNQLSGRQHLNCVDYEPKREVNESISFDFEEFENKFNYQEYN